MSMTTCTHNTMVETGDPVFPWKCADCGYVYGQGVARPDFETILKTIQQAYQAIGATPCRGNWSLLGGACCPGMALRRAKRLQGRDYASEARSCLRALLGGGRLTDEGFLHGFDGAVMMSRNGFLLGTQSRPRNDEEYADYVWAYSIGRRVAEKLGVL